MIKGIDNFVGKGKMVKALVYTNPLTYILGLLYVIYVNVIVPILFNHSKDIDVLLSGEHYNLDPEKTYYCDCSEGDVIIKSISKGDKDLEVLFIKCDKTDNKVVFNNTMSKDTISKYYDMRRIIV